MALSLADYKKEYQQLLLKQYFDKPNASGEIGAYCESAHKVYLLVEDFLSEFDLDTAVGSQLDILGRIVGIGRSVNGATKNDTDYRFLIRAKIAVNTAFAVMVDDTDRSIQDVIRFAFGNGVYVRDNQDMSLSLLVDDSVTPAQLVDLLSVPLLPKPQGVRYFPITQYDPGNYFGFVDNTDPAPSGMLGFSEQVFAPLVGGTWGELYTVF